MSILERFDIISFVPAAAGVILSAYNWLMMHKPGKIVSSEMFNYGYIYSSHHGGAQLCIPLVLSNEGAYSAGVTEVKIGFEVGGKSNYLDIQAKVDLNKVNLDQAYGFDWDTFESDGYQVTIPTYPIVIDAFDSKDVTFIVMTSDEDKEIPIGVEAKGFIEVEYNAGKMTRTEFPFFLSEEKSDNDNSLSWYRAIEK